MSWLAAARARTFALAGFKPDHAQHLEAEAFAEALIERYTGRVFGASQAFAERVNLISKSYYLPLPVDTSTVTTVAQAGVTLPSLAFQITSIGLAAYSTNDVPHLWQPGVYTITGQRGSTTVPEPIIKAASLLIGYYLRLSDPERSRFQGYNRGDFAGTLRFSELPVPEAEILLRPYASTVEVGLT